LASPSTRQRSPVRKVISVIEVMMSRYRVESATRLLPG
jgi:hypothetical protein